MLETLVLAAKRMQPQQSASWGTSPSPRQELAAALGDNIGQVSTEMIRKNMNIAPTLEIRPGYLSNVLVTKDLVLSGEY